jgi:DNA-binding NarL/FixJ family response regulator
MSDCNMIVIGDDHPMVRVALREAVMRAVPTATIIEADSHAAVYECLTKHEDNIDLVLLDLSMSDAPGFAGLFLIRGKFPAVPVVIVSAIDDPGTIYRSIDYGAAGFIPKSMDLFNIVEAIKAVLNGHVWLPEGVTRPAGQTRADAIAFAKKLASLTPQQLRVLEMIRAGKPNKVIAYELGNSEATIKTHVVAILRKLGVASRTMAVVMASDLAITTNDASPERLYGNINAMKEPFELPEAPASRFDVRQDSQSP